jgi:integrase
MERWKRLGIATHAVVEWNGKPIRSVRKGFAAAVKAAGLATTGPDRITPHVLRHAAASWAMQGGGDEAKIADYLGVTLEMLRKVYGHHHPDSQHDAVQAITAKPRSRAQAVHRMNVNKR